MSGLSPLRVFVACLPLAVLVGCDSDPYRRVVVSGSVTFDGEPIREGMIRFMPTSDTQTPPNGGYIKNGRYEVATRGGVAVGEYQVVIEAFSGPSTTAPDQPISAVDNTAQAAVPVPGQFLPKKYNEQSELTVIVEPGSDRMTKDFNLTP